ncbi:unnamed protein product [Rotaria sp. Silwood1]|nr:unnamed protein product [Rotaria sp. Silwood1]CAF3693877.1 unnamed protein product [Rotaria sp. Silwood1]CAF5021128.1 unnamed protein product [Rotaria sp. Silwood1]
MSNLNTFTSNIYSFIYFNYQIKTFKNVKYNKIISCIDYFPKVEVIQFHIYSYLYELKHYDTTTNNFPDGLSKCYRKILLCDERSFEHEFFLRIFQSFPILKK